MLRANWLRLACAIAMTGLLLLGPGRVSAALGGVLTYPGTCPSGQNLQYCIDNAASIGGTIALDQNDLSSESALITKSLTLRAAAGFSPELDRVSVNDDGSTAAMTVMVRNVTVLNDIEGTFTGGDGHSLIVDHVTVAQTDPRDADGISFDAGAPSRLRVTHSHIAFANEFGGIGVGGTWTGLVTVQLIGNTLTAHGAHDAGSGIWFEPSHADQLQADVMNNAIWDVASCNCGASAGVSMYPLDQSVVTLNLVGNTVDRSRTDALGIRNGLTVGGRVTVNAFDNILADSTGAAIAIDNSGGTASLAVLHAGYNDEFNNAAADDIGSRSAGPGNLAANPHFQAHLTGNLRLTGSSPLIDQGLVCSAGGVAIFDAAGNDRVHGNSVDLGAYEFGSTKANGEALVGSSAADTLSGGPGDDILCGAGGSDKLFGNGGNDYIVGGAGNDLLVGGPGADRLFGGSNADTLCAKDGVGGNDHVAGGPGNDGYRADAGDVIEGVEFKATCP